MRAVAAGPPARQRAEIPDYQEGGGKRRFHQFHELVARHDPHLQVKMFAIAAALLISVALLAAMQFRSVRGKPVSVALSAGVVGLVLFVGAATFLQVHHLGARVLPAIWG